jgi:hypothetical protein
MAFWRAVLRYADRASGATLAALKTDTVNWEELQRSVRQLSAIPVIPRLLTVADLLANFAEMGDDPLAIFCSLVANGNAMDSPPSVVAVIFQTLIIVWECELKEDRDLLALPAHVRAAWVEWQRLLAETDPELLERIEAVLKPPPQGSKPPNP